MGLLGSEAISTLSSYFLPLKMVSGFVENCLLSLLHSGEEGLKGASDSMKTNGCLCVPVAFYFRILKSVKHPSMIEYG